MFTTFALFWLSIHTLESRRFLSWISRSWQFTPCLHWLHIYDVPYEQLAPLLPIIWLVSMLTSFQGTESIPFPKGEICCDTPINYFIRHAHMSTKIKYILLFVAFFVMCQSVLTLFLQYNCIMGKIFSNCNKLVFIQDPNSYLWRQLYIQCMEPSLTVRICFLEIPICGTPWQG